jgi:hypothetical protein
VNTEIDERGQRFFSRVCEFKRIHPGASSVELDRYINKELDEIFGNALPPDQKNSIAAFGRAWRCSGST